MELTDIGLLRILSKESSDTKKNRGKTFGWTSEHEYKATKCVFRENMHGGCMGGAWGTVRVYRRLQDVCNSEV